MDYFERYRNGYLETIQRGIQCVNGLSGRVVRGSSNTSKQIARLKKELDTADAIVIGAGAGLSTSAGFVYSGERFEQYFSDFAEQYGIEDMYSGGFYPYPNDETYWAWWSRHIYINRYVDASKPVYDQLLQLVNGKDYFVITTNVDHQFQKAGFDKKRLFYTQGDYGLFQSETPTEPKTYDNEEWVLQAIESQGFVKGEDGVYRMPEDRTGVVTCIPTSLIPTNPDDGSRVIPNLRVDNSFVENEGWHKASSAYAQFLDRHQGLHVLFLELGVGGNTPVIIKYPFWQMTYQWPNAVYACINYSEAYAPEEIRNQSICIDGDIGDVLDCLKSDE